MRIDLPFCNLKTCRYCLDGNCRDKNRYDGCDYARLRGEEEKGLLLRMPVAIGQTIYVPVLDYYNSMTEKEEPVVLTMKVVEVKTGYDRFCKEKEKLFIGFFTENEKGESLWFYPEQIGERYFLLEAEAKQKLDEMMKSMMKEEV